MSNLLQCRCRVLIAALAVVFFCGTVVADKDSTRHIRTANANANHQHENKAGRPGRDLTTVAWTKPTYWNNYRKLLTLKRLKKCAKKQGVPPTTGSKCPTLLTGWYTCLFGEQTCEVNPDYGALPGLGDYVGGATLGMTHPAIRCDCEGGYWTCYDWDICLPQQAAPAPSSSPGAFCGGLAGIQCPFGFSCMDDPSDTCDPKQGGADCGGMCVAQQSCGSRGLAPCPDGQTCIDPDPFDNCDPRADCPGVCTPTPTPTTTDICPDKEPLGGSNVMCSKDLKCSYGTESCCGKTYDSLVCECSAGSGFGCFFTDACLSPSGPTTAVPPVVVVTTDVCPDKQPIGIDAVCSKDLKCSYGTESCCGKTFDSLVCTCSAGKRFGCFFTDACLSPSCPTTTVPPVVVVVEDPPDANNDAQCPAIVPQSGDMCPAYLPDTAVCGYGTVRCCNDPPITKTKCSCTATAAAAGDMFECSTIAIRCGRCSCNDGKASWPELVGTPGTDAKAVIEKENPCLTQVTILLKGSPIIKDFRLDRVWIFVDDKGDVVATPRIG